MLGARGSPDGLDFLIHQYPPSPVLRSVGSLAVRAQRHDARPFGTRSSRQRSGLFGAAHVFEQKNPLAAQRRDRPQCGPPRSVELGRPSQPSHPSPQQRCSSRRRAQHSGTRSIAVASGVDARIEPVSVLMAIARGALGMLLQQKSNTAPSQRLPAGVGGFVMTWNSCGCWAAAPCRAAADNRPT